MTHEKGGDARGVAARVLARVLRDGAFAAAALDAELRRAALDPRDARLATELVYGVLRTEPFLRETGERLASRGKLPTKPEARAHLLAGLYSLAFLDRLPPHAAVSEAVDGVRAELGEGPAKFANAILRGFARELQRGRPDFAAAVRASTPGWLVSALERALGEPGREAYLTSDRAPPPLALAVARATDRDAVMERLRAAAPGADVRPGALSAHAVLVSGGGDPQRLPGFEEAWIVQEEGAQVLALAAGARPRDVVLDACAGRGNKTWLLAHLVEPGGRVVACDLHPKKLERLASRVPGVTVHAVDWSVGPGDVPDGADRVLVDAPCSGTGTLRRRPDILRRLREEDLGRLAATQIAIALGAAGRARDGATLVYSVCSVLREECEDVTRALAAARIAGATLTPAPLEGPGVPEALRGRLEARLLPSEHGTDGYFLAGFSVRRGRESSA